MHNHSIDLLIWDCDGCLIDSELLACSIPAALLTEMGFPITAQAYVERFAGQGIRHSIRLIEEETGRSFMEGFPFDRLRAEREALFEASLRPIDGVHEALARINMSMCVASGSEVDRLKQTLSIAGLYERFAGCIFSAEQVERGKPAPDLLLFAARQMGAIPARCLVIEDSIIGVKAAQAAGMRVFGFAGASHVSDIWKERLAATGVEKLFEDMRELPDLLADCVGAVGRVLRPDTLSETG
ncbi:MAG TPA: HAD family hydrolase [Candidatus Baltobacteraceae bacterium]|jgi:HAD superfamily hydrolase (TIGR01509 family)|nr:HAD family hydrolase [Candidatus Baltobacteraceae bacterium]